MIGLFAMGTSCLALVCVIGLRRLPVPPARIRPFTGATLWHGHREREHPGAQHGWDARSSTVVDVVPLLPSPPSAAPPSRPSPGSPDVPSPSRPVAADPRPA